jgi:hypothetical protein
MWYEYHLQTFIRGSSDHLNLNWDHDNQVSGRTSRFALEMLTLWRLGILLKILFF